jgi:thymidine kinase
MAELVFYYGAMGCSKTANALMTRFQYIDKGLHVWLIKPAVDNRSGNYTIGSRVGITAEADAIIEPNDNVYDRWCHEAGSDLVICDEAQFLTEDQVDQLKEIAEKANTPVYCYGLRTDFRTKLFPGSKRLFEICSKTVELESICECGKPAIINARFNKDGHILTHGAQVDIGGDEKYKALCYSCWKELSKEDE